MIPLHWKWRDLGRAIKAARWAFYHANDLTMLKHDLAQTAEPHRPKAKRDEYTLRNWLGQRYLGSLPIS